MNNENRRGFIFKSIFIDGSFLFHCSQQLNVRIDYRKLRNFLIGEDDHLTGCTYYTALPSEAEMEDKHRAFLKLLKKELRIRVKSVPLMKIPQATEGGYERYAKGEDILLACDVIRGALQQTYDTAIIVTGDGDFVPLVQQVQDFYGKHVQIVAFRSALSQALEMEASSVIYLDDHIDKVKWVSPQTEELKSRKTFLGKILNSPEEEDLTSSPIALDKE